MRGFPPLEMLLVALLFLGAAFPLVRLTGAPDAVDSHVSVSDDTASTINQKLPVYAELRFAHAPVEVMVTATGTEIFTAGADGETELSFDWNAPIEGGDLNLIVRWPEGTPASAAELVLEPDGQDDQRRTFWGESEIDELWSVTWKGEAK